MRTLTDQRGPAPSNNPEGGSPRSVAVVGAGITGLVAAYELRRLGVNVTVYEATGQVGGAIRTTHADGFLAEHGPNAFLTSPSVDALLSQLGIAEDLVEASPTANRRYVVRDGALLPFPMTAPAMLTTRLLTLRAKLRVLLEPLVRSQAESSDESIASFVRRRLGHEVLDYAVDPFVSGIFAGDPETLSMAHALPRVVELERRYGSLSRGLVAQRRGVAHPAVDAEASPPTRPISGGPMTGASETSAARLISFVDGMQTLPDALEAALGGTIRLGCPVRLVHRQDARWILDAGPEAMAETRAVDAVVMATPAHVLAAMELPAALRQVAGPIESVAHPAMSTLTLGFKAEDVGHPLDGFGLLIPSIERRSMLGALFTSALFPARAPDGYVAISCFVGGARHPERAREETDLLVERALVDLRQLLGVRGEPVFTHHVYWPRAIPQYTVGYQAVKDAADETERANPGLYLAGNFRNGVSVGDCISSGQDVAAKVATYLAHAE